MPKELPSLTPYLIRAFYDWSVDNDFTPQICAVIEDDDYRVSVPAQYVEDGQIVLNISPLASEGLHIGNEFITFKARFAGKPEEVRIPIDRIKAIYIREEGFGLPFEVSTKPKLSKDQPKRGFSKV